MEHMTQRLLWSILILLMTHTAFAQFEGDNTRSTRKLPDGETWEWRIDNWDSQKGYDLVVEFTFYENQKFVKYQRVETGDKPFNEIYSKGTWNYNDGRITFRLNSKDRYIDVAFNPERNPSLFRYKVYKKQSQELIRQYTNEFSRLPVSSDYPQRLTNFN